MPNSLDLWREDPGWPISPAIILDTYWNYRRYKMLPQAGGWFDQDTHLIEAFKLMDEQVEWHKQNEDKRDGLPALEDVFAKRRKQFQRND
jgi:hypothetical protein